MQEWQNDFEKMSLHDKNSPQQQYNFQHRVNSHDEQKNNVYYNYNSPVTLQYKDSISSATSSSSRYSAVSSIDTQYYSSINSPTLMQMATPPLSRASTLNKDHYNSNPMTPVIINNAYDRERIIPLSPNQMSPISMLPLENYNQRQSFSQPIINQQNIIEPNGYFVPCKSLPFLQQQSITKNHYVIPTFAMAGQPQADLMKLLFNYVDNSPFSEKEEFERTVPLNIDDNTSLVTLSQHVSSSLHSSVSRSYLLGLGQRLGLTSILVIVSMNSINTIHHLLNNLIKSMQTDTQQNRPSWWDRVILVINQQHEAYDHTGYIHRKIFLDTEMPRIQEKYGLSQPLSTVFLSTQVYEEIKNSNKGLNYKIYCQRILWKMMKSHALSGRWCSEIATLQNRMNSISSLNSPTVNILTEDDESSSSGEENMFLPKVTTYKDFKLVKPKKQNKTKVPQFEEQAQPLQRRSTRRIYQKLHHHNSEDAGTLPSLFRHT